MMPAQNRLQRVVSNDATKSMVSIEVSNNLHVTIAGRIAIGRVAWPHNGRERISITKHIVVAYKPCHDLTPVHTIDAGTVGPWFQ